MNQSIELVRLQIRFLTDFYLIDDKIEITIFDLWVNGFNHKICFSSCEVSADISMYITILSIICNLNISMYVVDKRREAL